MKMKSLAALAALPLISLAPVGATAQSINFNVWVPPSEVFVREGLVPYFEAVEKDTGGKVDVTLFTAGQMMGPADTLPAIRDGALQGGFVLAAYNRNELKTSAIFDDIIVWAPDLVAASGAIHETFFQDCPECLEEFEANGLVPLGGNSTGPFNIMCRNEIGSADDLKGKSVRGAIDFHFALADKLEMTPVNVMFGEITQGFERGTLDCMFGGAAWITNLGLMDIIKTRVVEPSFGTYSTTSVLTFRKQDWEEWDADVREAFVRNAPRLVADSTIGAIEDNESSAKSAHEAGLRDIALGEELDEVRDQMLMSERERLIKAAEGRGVDNAGEILDAFLKRYAVWEGLSKDIGTDRAKFAEALWDRVYSKLEY